MRIGVCFKDSTQYAYILFVVMEFLNYIGVPKIITWLYKIITAIQCIWPSDLQA